MAHGRWLPSSAAVAKVDIATRDGISSTIVVIFFKSSDVVGLLKGVDAEIVVIAGGS